LKIKDFLKLYQEDSFFKTIAGRITRSASKGPAQVQVKGLIGSLDAVLGAALYNTDPKPHLYIMHDREEAAYFQNDLQNLMGDKEVLFFPTSYKRAYQFEETENANVLRRAEVLNLMNGKDGKELIITYPEALTEKVINKRSLRENTFSAKIGDKLDTGFVSEFLVGYDFDKTDFVYEPGQFSIRGGIIDVYSYAHDLPYRIELFGDEIESIRTFDPNTQLSVEAVKEVSLIPDVQTKLLQETRESFLDFLPDNTLVFAKDIEHTLESIQKYFEKAEQSFGLILQESGNTKVVAQPEEIFETRRSFLNQLKAKDVVEFGRRFYFKTDNKFTYQAAPQPSFNKDFKLLIDNLHDNQSHNISNIIVADSGKQMERLRTIFDELDPFVKFQPLNISFREGFIDKQLQLACYTDHQIFERFHKYRTKEKFSKSKALTLKELRSLQPGDYVTHVDYGIGRFAGLEK
jgi:transcription-repair coupling factor (superfamily II helicase)